MTPKAFDCPSEPPPPLMMAIAGKNRAAWPPQENRIEDNARQFEAGRPPIKIAERPASPRCIPKHADRWDILASTLRTAPIDVTEQTTETQSEELPEKSWRKSHTRYVHEALYLSSERVSHHAKYALQYQQP